MKNYPWSSKFFSKFENSIFSGNKVWPQPLLEVFLKLELIVLREEKAINQRQGENRSPEAKHREIVEQIFDRTKRG